MALRLSAGHRARIAAWAREAAPEETCGVLVGRAWDDERRVIEVVRLDNVAPASRDSRFLISPRQLADLERAAVRRALVVVGYFHSHPAGQAVPSPTDLEEAWPGFSYLIQPSQGSPRAWRLTADEAGFDEEAILGQEEDSIDCPRDCATKAPTRAGQDEAAMVSI